MKQGNRPQKPLLTSILLSNQAAGACLFVTSLLGWYLLAIQICASTGFPLPIPVGDFSRFWDKKANQAMEVKEERAGSIKEA